MLIKKEAVSEQLRIVIDEYKNLRSRSKHGTLSGIDEDLIIKFNTRAHAIIERIGGIQSPYYFHCKKIVDYGGYSGFQAERLFGVLSSLYADVEAGYLASFEEIIHSELFSDYLEMASYLLSEGYKDPAAVIAGATLESHLRILCKKYNISIGETEKAKKSNDLNVELRKLKVYSDLDQKSITAWLGLRNKAAHGDYDHYTAQQVEFLISAIRDFITRNPA